MSSRAKTPITGTFELHTFALPLDPDEHTVQRFVETCEAASDLHRRIKPLHLFLDYEGPGFVGVLQTSRYITGNIADGRRECARDAQALADAGFEVLREKVEAMAVNPGVPVSAADNAALIEQTGFDHYFEYHLLVDEEDERVLRRIATELSAELGVRIPLSYNALKPSQRFLNARTYGLGRDGSAEAVKRIEDAITENALTLKKVIREFIVSDTNKAVDNGWLEPPS